LYAKYVLADRLNKTISEIDAITVDEFVHWMAYIKKEVR
jgi:hypothetical protein